MRLRALLLRQDREWTLVPSEPTDESDYGASAFAEGPMPRQVGVKDCGVHMCMAADYIAADERLRYDQGDMRYFRMRMLVRILCGTLRSEVSDLWEGGGRGR